jgi:hypothetical protein
MSKNKTTKAAEVAAEEVEAKVAATQEEVTSSTTNTTNEPEASKKKKEALMYQPIIGESPEASIERLRPILWSCMTGYQPKQGYTPWAACRMMCNVAACFPDTTPVMLNTRHFVNQENEEDNGDVTILSITLINLEIFFKVQHNTFLLNFSAKEEVLKECTSFEEAKQFLRGKTVQEQVAEILATPPSSEGLAKLLELKKNNPDDEKLNKVVSTYTFAYNSLKQLTSITY